MSLSGNGGAGTPLANNPIQLQNPVAGTGDPPPVSAAGLPGAIPQSPIGLQQLSTATPLTGAAPLNTGLPQGRLQPQSDLLGQLMSTLGNGSQGARDATEAMRAAQRGVPAIPSLGQGPDALQQASQVLNLIKRIAGAGG